MHTQSVNAQSIHYNGCVLEYFIGKCGTALSQERGYPVHNLPRLNPNVTKWDYL